MRCLNCGKRIDEGSFCSVSCEDETLVSMGKPPMWARSAIERFKAIASRAEWVARHRQDNDDIDANGSHLVVAFKPHLKLRNRPHCETIVARSREEVPGFHDLVECSCERCAAMPVELLVRIVLK